MASKQGLVLALQSYNGRCRFKSFNYGIVPLLFAGSRQDNRVDKPNNRRGSNAAGVRFLREDRDEFGLEEVLQALCFFKTGETMSMPRPGDYDGSPSMVCKMHHLSATVQSYIKLFIAQQ